MLEKGETKPKLANLMINELFVVLDEGESFSTRVFSRNKGVKDYKLRCDAFAH